MSESEAYERIIARICRASDRQPIGTGVAVAQGYVLTCAHVVQAALGGGATDARPDRHAVIPLDFGLNCDLRDRKSQAMTFDAIVVEWLPCREDNADDIALLKLLETPSRALEPLEFAHWDGQIDDQRNYRVTGFPEPYGQTTHVYRPQGRIYDDRLQLEKDDDTEMRRIDSGYSGAPILDCQTGKLIGIVTTVETNNNYRAFAISTEKLERFRLAERLVAHELADELQLDELPLNELPLDELPPDDSRLEPRTPNRLVPDRLTPDMQEIRRAIATMLQDFNLSDADGTLRDQLSQLSHDRPPATGWETVGNLAYVVTRLRQSEHLPQTFRDRCLTYLVRRGHDCEHLQRQLNLTQTQPSAQPCHILVKIESGEAIIFDNDTKVAVWIYAVADHYHPRQLSTPDYVNTQIPFGDIPQQVWQVCRQRIADGVYPTVHYFLPRLSFDCAFEMAVVTRRGKVLGGEHQVVLRTDLARHSSLRNQERLQTQWQNRWQQAQSTPQRLASDVFARVCCRDETTLFEQLENRGFSAFFLDNCDAINAEDYSTVGELIDVAVEDEAIALPIVLWSRHPQAEPSCGDIFLQVLDKHTTITNVPERIRQLRAGCFRCTDPADPAMIGAHLALIWEDPAIPMPEHAQLQT